MSQKISGYTIDTIDIRLTSTIKTAAGSLGDRSGVRLRLETADGHGLGASAPIPGTPRTTSLEDLATQIRNWAESAVGRDVDELLGKLDADAILPLARFAVHTSLADLAARSAGVPLRQWLRAGSPDRVLVNALVADQTPKEVHATVSESVAAGFRAVKLKVGAEEVGLDATRIIAASEAAGNDAVLRLDANHGWTAEETVRIIGRVGPHRIDYVEDPTADPSEYGAISDETGVAMALDVTSEQVTRLDSLLEETGATVLVVKPAAVGGIDRVIDTARSLDDSQRLVVSSAIDGPIGLLAGLEAAAALPTEGLAHGLSTGSVVKGMPDHLLPEGGAVQLGDQPGLSALD